MSEPEPQPPSLATDAVLVPSEEMPKDAVTIKGYDWDQGLDYNALLESYARSGFQAQAFAKGVDEINRMINWRLSDEPYDPEDDPLGDWKDPELRSKTRCRIFLGYTSNLISSGLRETIKYLVKNKMVDAIVTTAGGIEEDLIKTLADTYVGDFTLDGSDLRKRGLNRIGNLLVPNANYCKFEDWMVPVLDRMVKDQMDPEKQIKWTPSRAIKRFGEEINHPDSVCYWAAKNDIPIYCPAITDGSIGDMMYFHSYRNPGLVVDLVEDIRAINSSAVDSKHTGMIILGGGVVKHHICNANLMRNGADYAVYLNTAQEFDGSDAGARPDEAKSWGKIRSEASPVKIYAEATLVFPLLVAQTFAKNFKPKE